MRFPIATGLFSISTFLAACVGDAPESETMTPDASARDSSVPDSFASVDAAQVDSNMKTEDAATVDASDAQIQDANVAMEAGPPTITCASESTSGAAFFTRSASIAAIAPGGAVSVGDYVLNRVWDGTGGQISGTASVLQQGSNLFLQFYTLPSGGVAEYGTKWIEPNPNGTITLTELCEVGKVGTVETGTYEMRLTTNPVELFINYGGNTRQQMYKHQ